MNRQARNRQARNRQHVQRWVIVTLCLAMVAGACSGGEDEPEAGARSENGAGPFSLRLSTGEQTGAASSSLAVAAGESLADDRVAQITDRLPTLEADDDDKADFTRPAESLPPPRVGETIELPFGVPAQQAPPEVPSGPLEVLRHQPDGDVAVAPFISVTFSQPMVPVGTLDQLDLTDVPIEVTPEVDGRWRWIGTRTLRLEHTTTEIDRLPAATDYTVTIPSGTESETGGALAEEFSFTFSTPPPQVISFTPSFEVIDTAPVFVATFDQRVDPDAVLDTIDLTAGGDTRGVRLATDDEVEADDEARAQVEQALDGQGRRLHPGRRPADRHCDRDRRRARNAVGRGTAHLDRAVRRVDPHLRRSARHQHHLRLRRVPTGQLHGDRVQQPHRSRGIRLGLGEHRARRRRRLRPAGQPARDPGIDAWRTPSTRSRCRPTCSTRSARPSATTRGSPSTSARRRRCSSGSHGRSSPPTPSPTAHDVPIVSIGHESLHGHGPRRSMPPTSASTCRSSSAGTARTSTGCRDGPRSRRRPSPSTSPRSSPRPTSTFPTVSSWSRSSRPGRSTVTPRTTGTTGRRSRGFRPRASASTHWRISPTSSRGRPT